MIVAALDILIVAAGERGPEGPGPRSGELILSPIQEIPLSVLTGDVNESALEDNAVEWTVSDPEVLELRRTGNPLEVIVEARQPGRATITVTVDVDIPGLTVPEVPESVRPWRRIILPEMPFEAPEPGPGPPRRRVTL